MVCGAVPGGVFCEVGLPPDAPQSSERPRSFSWSHKAPGGGATEQKKALCADMPAHLGDMWRTPSARLWLGDCGATEQIAKHILHDSSPSNRWWSVEKLEEIPS